MSPAEVGSTNSSGCDVLRHCMWAQAESSSQRQRRQPAHRVCHRPGPLHGCSTERIAIRYRPPSVSAGGRWEHYTSSRGCLIHLSVRVPRRSLLKLFHEVLVFHLNLSCLWVSVSHGLASCAAILRCRREMLPGCKASVRHFKQTATRITDTADCCSAIRSSSMRNT